MESKIYSRTVEFRDLNKNTCTVNINIEHHSEDYRRNYENLEGLRDGYDELSMSGECGGSRGQVEDDIFPRTQYQTELLNIWEEYHLNGMQAGTKKQMEFIYNEGAKDKIVWKNLVKANDGKRMKILDFLQILVKNLDNVDKISVTSLSQAYAFVFKNNLENKELISLSEYEIDAILMVIRGIFFDESYAYGSGWLVCLLPDDIVSRIDAICDAIETEEEEYAEQLEAVFDMGSEDFKPTREIVDQVMELRGCDEEEATFFLCLGMHLECTFGDLNDTFQVESYENHLYSANGIYYYIGESETLNRIAIEMLMDERDMWVEAVKNGIDDGLKEWAEDIIRWDGFESVLSTYDGSYTEHEILGNYIFCCRN